MYAKEQEKLTNFAFCPMYTPFKHEMVGIRIAKNTYSCLLNIFISNMYFQLQPNDYGSLNRTILTGMQNGNVDNNMNTM